MAGIDHTCIYFHNGMLMKDISHCDWLNTPIESVQYTENSGYGYNSEPINQVNLLPFKTDRDGRFMEDDQGFTYEDLTGQFKYDFFHRNRLIDRLKADKAHTFLATNYFWDVFNKYPEQSECIVRFLRTSEDDLQILLYESEDFNVTYYHRNENTWVVLGGYGHYSNPYTHFYHRGYGEQFERKMACECYNWLMEDLLEEVVDIIWRWYVNYQPEYEIADAEDVLRDYQDLFGYKSFWMMTPKERNNRPKTLQYDPDSIFPESKEIYADALEDQQV